MWILGLKRLSAQASLQALHPINMNKKSDPIKQALHPININKKSDPIKQALHPISINKKSDPIKLSLNTVDPLNPNLHIQILKTNLKHFLKTREFDKRSKHVPLLWWSIFYM